MSARHIIANPHHDRVISKQAEWAAAKLWHDTCRAVPEIEEIVQQAIDESTQELANRLNDLEQGYVRS